MKHDIIDLDKPIESLNNMKNKSTNSSEKSASMTDCRGNVVNVGDSVVYIKKTYCTSCLGVGSVTAIKSCFGKMTAFIAGGYHGVTSQSIYKVG